MSSQVLTSTCYDTIGLFFLSWLDFFFGHSFYVINLSLLFLQ